MPTISEHITSYFNIDFQSPIWLLVLPVPFLLFSIYLFNYTDPIPPRPHVPSPSTSKLQPASYKYKDAKVVSVSSSPTHNFTKSPSPSITLLTHLGVKDDAHQGTTVQHRSRLHITPPPANLRQVHLIASETLDEYGLEGGEIGENVCTRGIDLLSLSKGTRLRFIGPDDRAAKSVGLSGKGNGEGHIPTITVQGLRNPCTQIESHRKGLQEKFIVRDEDRKIVARKAGVMCTVDVGGEVSPGMRILVEEPERFEALGCV